MENRYGNRNYVDELRRRVSRVFLVLKSLGLIWTICFASAAPAQNRYQIIRIPVAQGANSAALGINNKGEVVGYSFQGEDYQTFLYSSSEQSLTDVGSFGGKINAACAINDAGQVTGYSQDGHGNLLAFVYSRKQPIASLGTLEGASTSEAFGINNSRHRRLLRLNNRTSRRAVKNMSPQKVSLPQSHDRSVRSPFISVSVLRRRHWRAGI